METLPRHSSVAEVARDKWTDVVTSFRSAPNSVGESPRHRTRKSRRQERHASPVRQHSAGPVAFGVTLRGSPSSSSESPPTSQPSFGGQPHFIASPCNANGTVSGAATAAEAATAAASSASATIESVIRVMFGSCASAVPAHQPSSTGSTYNASDFYVGRVSARRRSSYYGDGDDGRWGQPTTVSGTGGRAASAPRIRSDRPHGEGNYYAAFYADDHARAAQAVRHLREKDESQRLYPPRAQSADPRRHPLDPKGNSLSQRGPNNEPVASSPMRRSHSERTSPRSTPQRADQFPYRIREVKSSAPQQEDDDDDERTCFDDGISALSAVTLEEMARRERMERRAEMRRDGGAISGPDGMGLNQVPSQEGFDVTMDTLEEGELEEEFPHLTSKTGGVAPPVNHGGQPNHPVASTEWDPNAVSQAANGTDNMLSRVRSVTTRDSRRSRATHTSQSTNTTEFASVWRRDERKYWEEIVKDEEDVDPFALEKVKEEVPSAMTDGKSKRVSTTLATTSSSPDENKSPVQLNRTVSKGSETLPTKSLASSFDSPPRHPHETIQLSAKDCLPLDSAKKTKKKKARGGGFSGMLGMGRRGRSRKPGRLADEDEERYPVTMGTTASDEIGEI